MSNETNPNEEGSQPEGSESNPKSGGEFVTKEELKNVQKGIEKIAEQLNKSGRSQEEGETPTKPVVKAEGINPVVRKIYLKDNQDFLEVEDEVVEEATALGQDPIEYYESKKGWQLEAKARAEAKRAKEESKNNIESPSGVITQDSNVDFAKVSPDQIRKMDSKTYDKYKDYLRTRDGESPVRRKS